METKEGLQQHIFAALRSIRRWFGAHWDSLTVALLGICLVWGNIWYCLRYVEPEEAALRFRIVETAERWLGCSETDGSHEKIIDLYNSYEPSPRDYKVTYGDNWCATFGSAAALEAGLAGLIPMECSCEQQIILFDARGAWEENDCHLPRPGDYIYYVWDEWRKGDCTAWADHVGIVAETFGPIIKVIEGNKDDRVAYRYLFLNDICIRGYGTPDYRRWAAAME